MRTPTEFWNMFVTGTLAASAAILGLVILTSVSPAPEVTTSVRQATQQLPRGTPTTSIIRREQPAWLELVTSGNAPEPRWEDAPPPIETAAEIAARLHWNDPSVDPALLTKAFAPPARDLPAEALPIASDIHPSADDWEQLQTDLNIVAY